MDKSNQKNRELKQEDMEKVNGGSGYSKSLARGLARKRKPKIGVPEVEIKEKENGGHTGGTTGGW